MWWILIIVLSIILITSIALIFVLMKEKRGGTNNDFQLPHLHSASERAGLIGEKTTGFHLRRLLEEDEFLLANLLIPLRNGHKTEIDSVLISRKGIFCIEIKNWAGHIFGNDSDEYWIQKYNDPYREDRKHKNPIKQNENHEIALERLLPNQYKVYPVVIFSNPGYENHIDSNHAFSLNGFKERYENSPDILSKEEICQIHIILKPYIASPSQLKDFKEEMKKRQS